MDDLIEGVVGLLFTILLIGAAIYLAVLLIVYVVIPVACVAGYGWVCHRLGKTLFGRYQHTSRSGLALFGVGISAYAASIILLRVFIPSLESLGLLLLLALIPAGLIFLLAGLTVSEIWAYAKRFEITSQVSILTTQEGYLSNRLNTIQNQIQHHESKLKGISQREEEGLDRAKGLEGMIQAWVIRDAANRGLLVREWKRKAKNLNLAALEEEEIELNKIRTTDPLEEEQRRIKLSLVIMEGLERRMSEPQEEFKAIQKGLLDLSEEKKTLEGRLKGLNDQLSLMKRQRAILN